MPIVVAHAVPSEVQCTVGSECMESALSSGSVVWPHVAPPSREKKWACRLLPILLDAAMICLGWGGLIRMSGALRGVALSPEIFRLGPTAGAAAALGCGAGEGCRSWGSSIQECRFSKASG